MLIQAFPQLENAKIVRFLRLFFRSPLYLGVIVAAVVCGEVFSVELAVFYFFLAVGMVAMFLTEDTLAVLPIVACGYFTISPENSPAYHAESNIFTEPAFIVRFAFILIASFLLLVGRAVAILCEKPRRGYPRLAIGFLLLGLAYIAGGAFTPHYSVRTAVFGIVQLVSFLLPYLYFLCTVDWRSEDKDYLPMLFTIIGVGILLEIADMYSLPGVYREDGSVVRSALYTGWGVYNNIGCIMALCIPAPAYFAATRKNGWAYGMLSSVFLFGVALTQSRGSIIFGVATYLFTAIYVVAASKGTERWKNFGQYVAMMLLLVFLYHAFKEELTALFASLLEQEMDSSGRIEIYKNCFQAFLQNPVLGVGFYDTPGMAHSSVGSFLPPRAHNTYLQLLATGGCVAMAAYLFHRVQTLVLLLRHPSHEKMYVLLSIASLMMTSLLDCHFFNIGPGILYAVLLAYAEGMDRCVRAERRLKKREQE